MPKSSAEGLPVGCIALQVLAKVLVAVGKLKVSKATMFGCKTQFALLIYEEVSSDPGSAGPSEDGHGLSFVGLKFETKPLSMKISWSMAMVSRILACILNALGTKAARARSSTKVGSMCS